jgi:thiamine biosynthesis protein ThiS
MHADKNVFPYRTVYMGNGCIYIERMMKIKVNGEDIETDSGTLPELLRELEITEGRVAVELNLRVISKTEYGDITLGPGDNIEIVNFVGGG